MYQFAPGIRCLDCEMKQAQDEKERARVRTLAWAAYHAEHGEPLSLGEAAAMADAMGMTYGQYSLMLSKQKTQCGNKMTFHSIIFAFHNILWYTGRSRRLLAPSGS